MLPKVFNRTFYTLGIDQPAIDALQDLPSDSYYFQVNGRPVYSIDELQPNVPFQICFKLKGGKGGFGSLLKSFRIHRSSNQLMCRNLSGRRLTDVREEERLRKWIANTHEREKEKQRKKKEKLEKLKNGGKIKHTFDDVKYLRKRDRILDETEDAVEAGVAAMKEPSPEPGPSSSKAWKAPEKTPMAAEESDSDLSDIDLNGEIPIKKRRAAPVAYDGPEKKARLDTDQDSHAPKKIVVVHEMPAKKAKAKTIPEKIKSAGKKFVIAIKNTGKDAKDDHADMPKGKKEKTKENKTPSPPVDYPEVQLDNYSSADQLEILGLDHLKHALETRGLKCGGSLQERAARLFSVKGLAPEEYPKYIKAPPKKK